MPEKEESISLLSLIKEANPSELMEVRRLLFSSPDVINWLLYDTGMITQVYSMASSVLADKKHLPTPVSIGAEANQGKSDYAARADHVHRVPIPSAPPPTESSSSAGSSTAPARADHTHKRTVEVNSFVRRALATGSGLDAQDDPQNDRIILNVTAAGPTPTAPDTTLRSDGTNWVENLNLRAKNTGWVLAGDQSTPWVHTLTVGGSFGMRKTTVTPVESPYTVTDQDFLIVVDTTGGDVVLNLPNPTAVPGRLLLVEKQARQNYLTVNGSFYETNELTIPPWRYGTFMLYSDGTKWRKDLVLLKGFAGAYLYRTGDGVFDGGGWWREGSYLFSDSLVWFGGGVAFVTYTVSSDYTLSEWDTVLLVDASAGPVQVTLPDVFDWPGIFYIVKKIDSSNNSVTIVPQAGETIEGAANYVLDTPNQKVGLVASDIDPNWVVIID